LGKGRGSKEGECLIPDQEPCKEDDDMGTAEKTSERNTSYLLQDQKGKASSLKKKKHVPRQQLRSKQEKEMVQHPQGSWLPNDE